MDFNSIGTRDSGRDLDYLAQTLAEHGVLPMANMPTEVRDLTMQKPSVKSGPSADRLNNLMFAPGAVITKDKQKHRVLGITPSIQLQQGRSRNTDTNDDPPWSWRNQLTIDLSTNALIHVGIHVHATPPTMGPGDPEPLLVSNRRPSIPIGQVGPRHVEPTEAWHLMPHVPPMRESKGCRRCSPRH